MSVKLPEGTQDPGPNANPLERAFYDSWMRQKERKKQSGPPDRRNALTSTNRTQRRTRSVLGAGTKETLG